MSLVVAYLLVGAALAVAERRVFGAPDRPLGWLGWTFVMLLWPVTWLAYAGAGVYYVTVVGIAKHRRWRARTGD